MKNLKIVQEEITKRNKVAIKRGYFETKAQIKSRLINNLMKSWIGYDGTLWTLRAYLLKYNRKEYKEIVSCMVHYYEGVTFLDDKGDNLDQFNFFHYRANGIQHNYTSYDGRMPKDGYDRPQQAA